MELALMFKSTIAVLSVAGELIVEPFEINHDIEGVKLLEEKMVEEQELLERKKKEENEDTDTAIGCAILMAIVLFFWIIIEISS